MLSKVWIVETSAFITIRMCIFVTSIIYYLWSFLVLAQHALEQVTQAVEKRNKTALIDGLKSPLLGLRDINEEFGEYYMEMLVQLVNNHRVSCVCVCVCLVGSIYLIWCIHYKVPKQCQVDMATILKLLVASVRQPIRIQDYIMVTPFKNQ